MATGTIKYDGQLNGAIINTFATLPSGTSKTYTVSSGSRLLLVLNSPYSNKTAMYIVTSIANGTVYAVPVLEASGVSVSVRTNELTVAVDSVSGSCYPAILCFAGNFSE